jgi:pimeloyl-ACP methyl ester carboxylesterase
MNERHTISIPVGDSFCTAWLHLPTGVQRPPVVVMGHGMGATREMRLDAYAERFAARGIASIAFTYRNFGDSGGTHRQELNVKDQLRDWEEVLAHARGRDDVDTSRIAVWGTSFGGGHAITIASRHPDLAAAVAQCPFTDGLLTALPPPDVEAARSPHLSFSPPVPATADEMTALAVRMSPTPSKDSPNPPVVRVAGMASRTRSTRTITSEPLKGQQMEVKVQTHVAGTLEFANGAIVSIATSFDVPKHSCRPIELHGSLASLQVPDSNRFGGPISLAKAGQDWIEMPLTHAYSDGNFRSIGVADMAHALRAGRAHRASGELALHALEVMEAFEVSSETGRHVSISTHPNRPEPLAPGVSAGPFDQA